MSEAGGTRRDLFKTSVVTALGLTSVAVVGGTVAGFGLGEYLYRARLRTPPTAARIFEPYVLGAHGYWVIYSFDPDHLNADHTRGAYWVQKIPNSYMTTYLAPFDTERVYQAIHANLKPYTNTPTTIDFQGNPDCPVDANSYLQPAVGSADINMTATRWSEVQKS